MVDRGSLVYDYRMFVVFAKFTIITSQYYNLIHSKGAVILTVNLYDNLGTAGFSLKFFANNFARA